MQDEDLPQECADAGNGHTVLMRHHFVFQSVATPNTSFQLSETQHKESISVTNILQQTSFIQLNKLHAAAAWSPDHFKSLPASEEGEKPQKIKPCPI